MQVPDSVIGRGVERDLTRRFLDVVPEGPSALLLEGEPGIGKTTLWREVVAGAESRGYHVLVSRPTQTETQLSYAAFADLLSPVVSDVIADLPSPQRRAIEVVLFQEDEESSAPDPRGIAAALRSAIIALARSAPVVLAVDDLQWIDAPTAVALGFCLRRLDVQAVSLVAAVRVEAKPAGVPFSLDQILPEGRLHRCTVGPLSMAALHQLIRTRLPVAFPRPTMVKIHTACRGNPFFALEIARALHRSDAHPRPGEPLPVPLRVQDLVSERITELPLETQEVLRAASADPRPTLGLLRQTVGATALSALAPAQDSGLVHIDGDAISFTHPLFAAAVYASTTDAVRRDLHQRLAEVADSGEARARHLALGTETPDEEIASTLDAAAHRADRGGAPSAAAEIAEHALRLTPASMDDAMRDRSVLVAGYNFRAGDLVRARGLLEEVVRSASSGPTRAEAMLLLAEVLFNDHQSSRAAQLLRAALDETDEPSILARIQGYLAFERNNAGDFRECEPHARAALEHAEQAGDRVAISEATAVLALVECVLGKGADRRVMARALELEDMDHEGYGWLRPSLLVSFIEILSDSLPAAQSTIEHLYARTLERGRDNELPYQLGTLVTICCWRGHIELVESYVTESLLLARAEGGPARGTALYAAGLLAAVQGKVDEARRDLEGALGLLDENLAAFRQWTLAALGFLCVSTNDYEGADRLLTPLNEIILSSGVGEPRVWCFLPDEIEALLALGRDDEAEPLLAYLEERGRALDRPWALGVAGRYRALQRAAAGDLDGALVEVNAAVGQHERADLPIEIARTLIVKGQIHRRRKERRAARVPLEKALEMFETMGMPLWAGKARAELDRLGIRSADSFALTPTEDRIARLAASGMTNREVAEAVFVSPKTVEANLARVYRKLGIRSRAELGAKMHTSDASSLAQA